MSPRLPASWLLSALLGAGAACADATPSAELATVRDSAGITVADNTGPRWTDAQRWRITDRPVLAIGVLEGPEAYQMYRVGGVLQLEDGRIVVSNGGTQQVRYYDRSGLIVHEVGSEGEGPGEFRGLGSLMRFRGDSLLAFDRQLRRVTVLDGQGRVSRTFPVEAGGTGFPMAIGWLEPGGLASIVWRFGMDEEFETGYRRDPLEVSTYDAEGRHLATLGTWPGMETRMEIGESFMRTMAVPFGRASFAATSSDHVYVGTSDRWRIEVRDASGALTGLIRRSRPLDPVEPSHREAFREEYLARANDEEARQRLAADLTSVKWQETFPAFSALTVDALGDLWVGAADRPGEDGRTWTVFDPEGRLLGDVTLPADLTVHDVGTDYVAGVYRDELEVEFVLVYGLEKPEGA